MNPFNILDSGEIRDPIFTKEILEKLTPAQNQMLEQGRLLINPITGDTIVPIRVSQNQIARIIVNIF
jgi:hypothetical protein